MWCYFLIVIIVLPLLHIIQRLNYKRGILPKKAQLLRRSRLAIILAGVGVISYIIPIIDSQVRYQELEVENSIRLDTLEIRYWERVPVRYFQEGLYSREELALLEADYQDLRSWMDGNSKILHDKMKNHIVIEEDALCMPIPKSVIGAGELTYYRQSFLGTIKKYNQDVSEYINIRIKEEIVAELLAAFNYLMPLLIILAMALQLNVVFWNYQESTNHIQ